MLREIGALLTLHDHPNIVKLLDVFKDRRDGSKLYLMFEYMDGGDLRNYYLKRFNRGLPFDAVLGFA